VTVGRGDFAGGTTGQTVVDYDGWFDYCLLTDAACFCLHQLPAEHGHVFHEITRLASRLKPSSHRYTRHDKTVLSVSCLV